MTENEKYRLRHIKETAEEIVELIDTTADREMLDDLMDTINLDYKRLQENK